MKGQTLISIARTLLLVLGGACAMIALAHILLGPAVIPGGAPANATTDSEDRFYAVFFMGFGLALIWCARDLDSRHQLTRLLLALFFTGGIARLISMTQVGLPHDLFVALTVVELVLPVVLMAMISRGRMGDTESDRAALR